LRQRSTEQRGRIERGRPLARRTPTGLISGIALEVRIDRCALLASRRALETGPIFHCIVEQRRRANWQDGRSRRIRCRLSDTVPTQRRRQGQACLSARSSVQLTWTPCHLGGQRPWFLCEGVRARRCRRRTAILYDGGGWFACRDCCGLAYRSQQETPLYRSRRARKATARLGASPSMPLSSQAPRVSPSAALGSGSWGCEAPRGLVLLSAKSNGVSLFTLKFAAFASPSLSANCPFSHLKSILNLDKIIRRQSKRGL
jgi:hypothetical protein